MPSPDPVARRAWRAAALAGAVVAATALVPTPAIGVGLEVVLYALALGAVRTARVTHGSPMGLAWEALGAVVVAFGLSSAVEVAWRCGVAVAVTGPGEAVLDGVGYVFLGVAAGAGLAGRHRVRGPEAWADTVSLVLAAGLAAVVVTGATGLLDGRPELLVGIPVVVATVLVACVPMAASSRSASGTALLVAGLLLLAGFVVRLADLGDVPDRVIDAVPLAGVAALVLAARHPSVAGLGLHTGPPDATARGGVAGLGATLLVSPALLLLTAVGRGADAYLVATATTLLTAFALWRLARLIRERDRVRSALVAGEQRLRVLFENAADVIAVVDDAGRVGHVSPAVTTLLGTAPETLAGRRALGLVDRRDRRRLLATAVAADARTAGPAAADVRLRHADGSARWVEVKVGGRVDAGGVDGRVLNVREITDRKQLEDELRHQATTDSLTGLANRAQFLHRLDRAVGGAPGGEAPAVLFVDLDDFKAVNDTAGHAAGDQLLLAVAGRLRSCVRTDDVVARLGGDEFAVLLTGAGAERLAPVAARVLDQLRRPVAISTGLLAASASIGGAAAGAGDDAEVLLHRADTAMYTAKRRGKNACVLLGAERADAAPA